MKIEKDWEVVLTVNIDIGSREVNFGLDGYGCGDYSMYDNGNGFGDGQKYGFGSGNGMGFDPKNYSNRNEF